ncbi:TetR/AcrR family transcriptional regulator [Burkholderia sp. BCC1999]|uniref:TetR/AcrR family transcriptional regulator n=1 Tax=Burkholderia sp. BCC1999 TaxID=2817448 RepID=UPI002AC36B98|nr:TetR/AcrR family transcriptional regulator [Burkholderia sp. BCC1999]
MGRSNREQADRNRERIVEEADAVVRSGGVAAVSIAEIMARVGLTQGGFYNHFASKDALVTEACAAGFARAAQNWKAKAQAAGRPVAGGWRRLVAYYLGKKAPERSCPMVALGQDAAPHHASDAFNDAYRNGVRELYTTFVTAARDDPSCAMSDDELRVAFAAMVGANLLARATGDRKWATDVERALVDRPRDA